MKNAITTTGRAALLRQAHGMTRSTVEEFPGADYHATLAAALRLVWAEPGAAAAWASMNGAEQWDALRRMTRWQYGRRDARSTADGKPLPNVFIYLEGMEPAALADELDGIAADAWTRMAAALDDPRRAALPLGRLLARAVLDAARTIGRRERRHPSALRSYTTDDGRELERIDTTTPTAEPIAPGPEAAAILLDAIDRAAADDLDRQIIRRRAAGYSNREIAAALQRNRKTIDARAAAISRRYYAAGAD